jgi:hypothetical protein
MAPLDIRNNLFIVCNRSSVIRGRAYWCKLLWIFYHQFRISREKMGTNSSGRTNIFEKYAESIQQPFSMPFYI